MQTEVFGFVICMKIINGEQTERVIVGFFKKLALY